MEKNTVVDEFLQASAKLIGLLQVLNIHGRDFEEVKQIFLGVKELSEALYHYIIEGLEELCSAAYEPFIDMKLEYGIACLAAYGEGEEVLRGAVLFRHLMKASQFYVNINDTSFFEGVCRREASPEMYLEIKRLMAEDRARG